MGTDANHPYWSGYKYRPMPNRRIFYTEDELFLMEERREDPDDE